MDAVYDYPIKQYDASTAEHQLFFAKSKVPICLAITDCLSFLNELKDAGFISEEESLELQADTRSVPRVVYECLCWIEEKDINLQKLFKHLFQEPYLTKYPDLQHIVKEYEEEKCRSITPSPSDTDTDHFIFAQDKVPICLAITDRFPFLHGLQDRTILSETEALKLQADERPVSRVIYECLCLIEKKDMKLNVVFEYIFQQCYLKVYPALLEILQESSGDQAGPFNGRRFPVFSRDEDLLEFFDHNKTYICDAVDERFPILHGLQDERLLSRLQVLKLQADKRPTKEVMHEVLCLIKQQNNIEQFFAYVFQDYYLELFPGLKTILKNLNDALELEIYPPSPDVYEVFLENGFSAMQEQESSGPSTDLDDPEPAITRKCRMKHINYSEPPDFDLECDRKKGHKAPEPTLHRRFKQRRQKPPGRHHPNGHRDYKVATNVTVRLELPKQAFDEKFQVKCGNKRGIFLKKYWSGDSRNDRCIKSEGKMFTVILFEKYGGKESSKNWKKSISCERVTMDTLIRSGVLKTPIPWKKRGKPFSLK